MPTIASVPSREPLDNAVLTLLRTVTGKPIGHAKAPTQTGNVQVVAPPPYGILYPINGGTFWGPPWTTMDEAVDFHYQVTSVGLRADQAQFISDLCRHALLDQDTNFQFVNALSASGLAVLLRQATGSPGGAMPSDKLWAVVDTYAIQVQAV